MKCSSIYLLFGSKGVAQLPVDNVVKANQYLGGGGGPPAPGGGGGIGLPGGGGAEALTGGPGGGALGGPAGGAMP